jgi:hypothetical protein
VPATEYAYKAFISYSHAADGRLAPALQLALHRFAKPWYRLRAVRVFRDRTNLSANPGLWSEIHKALEQSEFLLLMASTSSAASKWVRQELTYWLGSRDPGKLIIVLTDGAVVWNEAAGDFDWHRTTALPDVVRGKFKQEPLYTDLTFAKGSEQVSTRHPEFLDRVATIAAALHGRSKDEIFGEDVRQHWRTRSVAGSAVLLLFALAVAASTFGWLSHRRGNELSNSLTNESKARRETTRQLAASAWQNGVTARDVRKDMAGAAHYFFRSALALREADEPPSGIDSVLYAAQNCASHFGRRFWTDQRLLSADQHGPDRAIRVFTSGPDNAVTVWDFATAKAAFALAHPAAVDGHLISRDGHRLLTWMTGCPARVWDLADGRLIRELPHEGKVCGGAFDRRGERVITWEGNHDNGMSRKGLPSVAHLWDLATQESIQTIRHKKRVLGARFNTAESHVLTWTEDGLPFGDDGGVKYSKVGQPDAAICFRVDNRFHDAFLARNDMCVVGVGFADVVLWSLDTGVEVWRIKPSGSVRGAIPSPDGRRLLTWSDPIGNDKCIGQLWDLVTGKEVRRFEQPRSSVRGAVFRGATGRLLTWGGLFTDGAKGW